MPNNINHNPPAFRVNNISLGPFERRVLPWMAKRLPGWVTPDHLTFLGQFAALLIGFFYWLTNYSLDWLWLVNLTLVLHWWADSLDGTLARVRKIERRCYGFFIDHHSDTISVFCMCFGMGLSPIMDMRVALSLVLVYYAMMVLVYLVSMCRGVFKISFAGIGPTEVRLLLIISNIIVWKLDNKHYAFFGQQLTLFSLIGLCMAVLLFLSYLVFGEIERRKISVLDPTPKPNQIEE